MSARAKKKVSLVNTIKRLYRGRYDEQKHIDAMEVIASAIDELNATIDEMKRNSAAKVKR